MVGKDYVIIVDGLMIVIEWMGGDKYDVLIQSREIGGCFIAVSAVLYMGVIVIACLLNL